MKVITDRRLSDTVTAVYVIVVGVVGVFLPVVPSQVIEDALPGAIGAVMYAGLILAGFLILAQSSKGPEGPAMLVAGLSLATAFMLAYSIGSLGERGPVATVAVMLHLVLSLTNLYRIYEVSRASREAQAAITRGS